MGVICRRDLSFEEVGQRRRAVKIIAMKYRSTYLTLLSDLPDSLTEKAVRVRLAVVLGVGKTIKRELPRHIQSHFGMGKIEEIFRRVVLDILLSLCIATFPGLPSLGSRMHNYLNPRR